MNKSDIKYKYLIISSYNPENHSRDFILESAGLYYDEGFLKTVKCSECEGDVFVMFDAYNLPEVGQCVECGSMTELYYFVDNIYADWQRGGR